MGMEQRLVIFFGKTGVGKNYVAQLFAKAFDYHFYDADQDLPGDMQAAIAAGQTFTDEMRCRYAEIIKERTTELLKVYSRLALTQGLFKNKQRHELLKRFPFAVFIWVDADDQTIEERVRERGSEVTLDYARNINPLFEAPDFDCEKINNHGGAEDLIYQLNKLGVKICGLTEKDCTSKI